MTGSKMPLFLMLAAVTSSLLLVMTTEAAMVGQCDPNTGNQRLPDDCNCKIYYKCNNDGTVRSYQCPLILLFNPRLGICDLPYKVEDSPCRQSTNTCGTTPEDSTDDLDPTTTEAKTLA